MSNYYQASSPPTANRATKPGFSPSASNAYVANNNSYIASPFDDDPVPQSAYNPSLSSHSTEKDPYTNPYNPDYMPTSAYSPSNNNNNNNRDLAGDQYQGGSFHQSSFHSTQEHSLSPSFKEKSLAGGAGAEAGEQTYAMQHLNQNDSYNHNAGGGGGYPFGGSNPNAANSSSNYAQANPQYYNGYDEERPSISNDTSPMRPLNDPEAGGLTRGKSGVTRLKYGKEKSKYLPCFPCIRSTCGRFTCCFCLILLLGIIALAVVIVTVFKLPKVDFQGMQGEPVFSYNQGSTTFAVNLTANIEVQNPNPIGFNFESITATAYYPDYAPSIGGGSLHDVNFPSKSNITLHFPINASYDRLEDPGFTVMKDIITRCGIAGGAITNIAINYDLKLTIRIIGIPISPTIKNQHVSIPCPTDINNILNNIPGGLATIVGGTTK
ncbi:hypothetical protein EC957_008367 [Mortierella hygrophila]|uniref:Late embryogenesis abundant protein LEA-2 subgroup domain-containing protein n=1 Tax=Mortierella hygrophila TaxID=979708 RepID=A0A9P6K581_9FUNG|nr:hypothetical protein EC957_008367 [Mortierella hygrophila]